MFLFLSACVTAEVKHIRSACFCVILLRICFLLWRASATPDAQRKAWPKSSEMWVFLLWFLILFSSISCGISPFHYGNISDLRGNFQWINPSIKLTVQLTSLSDDVLRFPSPELFSNLQFSNYCHNILYLK